MKLEEAIEILTNQVRVAGEAGKWSCVDAFKLGIEALKAYQKAQDAGWYPPGYKLPGEIKD